MMLARFRLKQMWICSLNCLCHITRNNQVVMSRKCIPVYIQRVSVLLVYTFCFMTLCDLSQAEGHSSKDQVENVTVEEFCSEERQIKLNVSWQYPEEFNSSNQVHISIEDNNCIDCILSPLLNSSVTSWVMPDQNGKIKSGHAYIIKVSTSKNEGAPLHVLVDDENCTCKNDPLQANLNAVQKSNDSIQVSWKVSTEWLTRHTVTRYIVKIIYLNDTHKSAISNNKNITNNDLKYNQETNVNVSGEVANLEDTVAKLILIDDNNCNYGINGTVKPATTNAYHDIPWNYIIPVILCIGSALSMLLILKSHCLKKLFSLHRQMYKQPQTRRIYRRVNNDELRFRYELKSIQTISQNNPDGEKENVEEMARNKADKYEICYGRLKIGAEIGGGAFGQVFLATVFGVKSIPDHSIVAVKKLKKTAAPEELDEFLLEISMLKKIGDHPNIVRLLGYCTVKQPYCMIMEYVPCGDLLQYLRILRQHYEQKGRAFLFNTALERDSEKSSECSYITPETPCNRLPSVTETEYTILSSLSAPRTPVELRSSSSGILEYVLDPRELQNFALQIAQGMSYLENKQIVHRDLAARNVLIDENKTLKISDFGLSRSGIYVNSKHKKVPLRWLSVEAIRDNLYTSKSDVWAYGIVLWELGTLGGFPYPTISDRDILPYLLNGERLEKPGNCTDEFYAIMLQCWAHDKDRRPSFEQLVNYLESVPKNRKIYVDFCQLNPLYIFPPTQQQTIAQNRVTEKDDYSLRTDL